MKDKFWKQFIDEDERALPVLQPKNGISRRTFLELLGYTTAAITLTSCVAPEQKIIPYLKQPPELTPGVANWYASTCGGCSAGCGTLVKVRDGRPIKLEGNPEHPLNKGGLCPVAHSLVFGLYDSERLQQPLIGDAPATWAEIDAKVIQQLNAIKESGGKVRFLSNTIISPTSRATIGAFLAQFKDAKHIVYEPISNAAIRLAHQRTHGIEALPTFRFEKAKLIISFGADFLGTWISPTALTRSYSEARDLKREKHEMLRHIQIESRLSLTGANADKRVKVASAEETDALLLMAKLIAATAGSVHFPAEIATFDPSKLSERSRSELEKCADELIRAKGSSLVLCGSNDTDEQHLVNVINQTLGNYGTTIFAGEDAAQGRGRDEDMQTLLKEMKEGSVAAIFMLNANPAYDYFAGTEFTNVLTKVPLRVSLSPTIDETASLADLKCPTHHSLEAWDDAEAENGVLSLNQPTIAPLFNTRAYQESLMRWSGDARSFIDVLRSRWQTDLFKLQGRFKSFDEFWDKSLHDGVFIVPAANAAAPIFKQDGSKEAFERLAARSEPNEALTLSLYQKVTLRDGRYGNNPWLHEIPDPISKTTWDNYACISSQTAAKHNISEGQVVRIKGNNAAIELPVLIQAGQSDDCVAVALGYGRTKAGKVGNNIGSNAFPFVQLVNGTYHYRIPGITLESTANKVNLAKTQTQESAQGRPLIKEYSLADFISGHLHEESEKEIDLWKPHDFPEHKWGMVIDLNSCVGCNACVISCQAENNISVVGKDEVHRRREMHWMRIDRYYDERPDGTTTRFQPMTCEHCDNASCETVCPVLATVHSSEGLNMQVYNRCVGTRYCANNCPFKVRRFNWFLYPHDDQIANLALNPDVTVRSRGVMEKCTFCVQRIEEVKVHARNDGRPIQDGEVQTACQQSCPANAISFGDLKDLESRVSKLRHSKRNYILLEELNLRPGLTYLAKVRNDGENLEA